MKTLALAQDPRVILTEPLGRLELLGLSSQARLIVTDSGGGWRRRWRHF